MNRKKMQRFMKENQMLRLIGSPGKSILISNLPGAAIVDVGSNRIPGAMFTLENPYEGMYRDILSVLPTQMDNEPLDFRFLVFYTNYIPSVDHRNLLLLKDELGKLEKNLKQMYFVTPILVLTHKEGWDNPSFSPEETAIEIKPKTE